MINNKKVLALVPARKGSKGLPCKNSRLLNGRPLLAWPVKAARASSYVDEVILSTDSEEYADIGREFGARVPFIRPADLALDTAPSIDFILHAIAEMEALGETFDYLVLLEPTSPLTEAGDIDAALEKLEKNRPDADALVGVAAMETTHPAYAVRLGKADLITPLMSDGFDTLPRRQDLDPLFCLDGSLYISTPEALRTKRGFCHSRTLGFVMPRYKSLEVDDFVDFICIEAIAGKLDEIARETSDN